MALGDTLKGLAGAAFDVAAGTGAVMMWRNYRCETTYKEIDEVVVSALKRGDRGSMAAIHQAFADQIRDADSPEMQTHLNDLLIYFKLRLRQIAVSAAGA